MCLYFQKKKGPFGSVAFRGHFQTPIFYQMYSLQNSGSGGKIGCENCMEFMLREMFLLERANLDSKEYVLKTSIWSHMCTTIVFECSPSPPPPVIDNTAIIIYQRDYSQHRLTSHVSNINRFFFVPLCGILPPSQQGTETCNFS